MGTLHLSARSQYRTHVRTAATWWMCIADNNAVSICEIDSRIISSPQPQHYSHVTKRIARVLECHYFATNGLCFLCCSPHLSDSIRFDFELCARQLHVNATTVGLGFAFNLSTTFLVARLMKQLSGKRFGGGEKRYFNMINASRQRHF